ncbi:MAG: hypothetical protein Q7S10_02365 [bacterium]|nr:hypothetical protein [bacterium]
MLAPITKKLVEEIFGSFGNDTEKLAKEDPEACLVSMLTRIKEQLPNVCATLGLTIEFAAFNKDIKEAKRKIKQAS